MILKDSELSIERTLGIEIQRQICLLVKHKIPNKSFIKIHSFSVNNCQINCVVVNTQEGDADHGWSWKN